MRSLSSHDQDTHGDKPWVYFMIDCFFLITAFTIMSFQLRTEEEVLENKLPPVGRGPGVSSPLQPIHIHVKASNAEPRYRVEGSECSEAEMRTSLQSLAQLGPERYRAKISYDADTPWGDVVVVFNACTVAKIRDCGLVPIRGIN
jgi:biopolymer transport protein ExbD